MEAHLAPTQPTQVNKITTSCEICSGPYDTHYCMEDPKEAFVEYASSRTNQAGDARLSKFEADFKQQQSEMTNKIDTVLKAITDRIAGTLPSDTVKNPKLSTALQTFPRQACRKPRWGLKHNNQKNPEDTNTIVHIREQRDTPLLEQKDITVVDNIGSNKDDRELNLDLKKPLGRIKTKEITFKTPYKDPERSGLSREGHDLLSSRVILSEDDYDRGCRKPSNLEEGLYRDTIKLGPEYVSSREWMMCAGKGAR
ncbi:hypothetical protein Tco_1214467 [Tanacetum coccineum]